MAPEDIQPKPEANTGVSVRETGRTARKLNFMRTEHFPETAGRATVRANRASAHKSRVTWAPDPRMRTLLLISDDARFYKELRPAANAASLLAVRTSGGPSVPSVVQVLRPAVVVLDLDLPAESAWGTADLLLQEKNCPPVVLLTGRSERFDVSTAIQAGSLVDKSAGAGRLLEVAGDTLASIGASQAEQNAVQRIVLRWLKPYGGGLSAAPALRFWGINE
jgi:ActR/RegA family two-component response regulator